MNSENRLDYLVGGFRISVKDDSNTPGPRNHILNFIDGGQSNGLDVRLFLVSTFRFMSYFSRLRQSDYTGSGSSKVWVADIVRIIAALWCGFAIFVKTVRGPAPIVIYERVAVFQSLSSFHAAKRKSIRVVEANGILSRETSQDRKVLKAVKLASWLERRALRRADLVVAVSEALKTELVGFADLEPSKVLVVPNGVPRDLIEIPRRPSSGPVIGFAGSVVAWHHLDDLIEVMQLVNQDRLADNNEPLRLEIVGDGPELSHLNELVAARGLSSSVRFFGRLSQSETYARMTSWTIGYAGHRKSSSSAMYHSPLKLYEYASLGLDILCTRSDDALGLADSGARVQFHEGGESLRAGLNLVVDLPVLDDRGRNEIRHAVYDAYSWTARVRSVLEQVGVCE